MSTAQPRRAHENLRLMASFELPLALSVDLRSPPRPLHHRWQWCVGSGHATLALRADWQAQLTQARHDLAFRHVRFHGLLNDDMGTLLCENDQALYSFFNIDRIFDFLLSIGMKPVVELSFMPRMLASGDDVVFHYAGNVTPPKDLVAWGELMHRLASHWVSRYGIEEVSTWPLECWNEPNLKAFWTGDQRAYFELYRATVTAIKRVDQRLQVGGPATAENAWLDEFTAFCRGKSLPLDFVSTHYYPTDAFGKPGSDIVTQLAHSPPGVMRQRAIEARAAADGLPLYYTEWSISSNPRGSLHDTSFAAAFAVRIAMSVDDVVDGYSYWTFSDVFEENYLPSKPYHGGFGMMNLYGVPKPIYRAFEMIKELGGWQLDVRGDHPTVAAWCSGDSAGASATTMVLINQALPNHHVTTQALTVRFQHRADQTPRSVSLARIDADHANPTAAWHAMGEPEYPSTAQIAQLLVASRVTCEAVPFKSVDGVLSVELALAPQSVNQLLVQWNAS